MAARRAGVRVTSSTSPRRKVTSLGGQARGREPLRGVLPQQGAGAIGDPGAVGLGGVGQGAL